MIEEVKIFEDLKDLQKRVEILANPLRKDSGEVTLWKEVYDNIHNALLKVQKDRRIYGW